MTREQHLLTILAEECAEIAQRCSKALRFGLKEVEPGQPFNNGERILLEVADMAAVLEMLQGIIAVAGVGTLNEETLVSAKKERVEKYLELSYSLGTYQP